MRRGRAVARNGIAAALAVLTATGYLLGSGALDPVLEDAVAVALGQSQDEEAGGVPALHAVPITDWMYFDDRPEWSSARGVAKVPSRPDQPVEPARPEVAPPENPHRWQFSGPAPMPRYSLEPMSSCVQPRGPGNSVAALTAVAGTKSAAVTWWDLGDPDTVSYQLTIVPIGATGNPVGWPGAGQKEKVRFITVPAPNQCKQVTVQVTGLTSGDGYRFWLLALNRSPVQNRTYRHTRGETETVTVN